MKKIITLLLCVTLLGAHPVYGSDNALSVTPEEIDAIMYDAFYVEDKLTGDRCYYSSYVYYMDENGVVYHNAVRASKYKQTPFRLMLYESDNQLKYMLSLIYVGDDWIFFDKWMAKAGDHDLHEFDLSGLNEKRDVANGRVIEKYSFYPREKVIDLLHEIIDAGECTIRLAGDKQYTFDLSPEDIKCVTQFVGIYDQLNSEG